MQRNSVSLEELGTTIVDNGLIAWVGYSTKHKTAVHTAARIQQHKHSTELQGTVGQLTVQYTFSTEHGGQ